MYFIDKSQAESVFKNTAYSPFVLSWIAIVKIVMLKVFKLWQLVLNFAYAHFKNKTFFFSAVF